MFHRTFNVQLHISRDTITNANQIGTQNKVQRITQRDNRTENSYTYHVTISSYSNTTRFAFFLIFGHKQNLFSYTCHVTERGKIFKEVHFKIQHKRHKKEHVLNKRFPNTIRHTKA